jgi:hypothetical protein
MSVEEIGRLAGETIVAKKHDVLRGDQGPLRIGQGTRIRFASVCWLGSHGPQPLADAIHLHRVLSRNYCFPRPPVVLLIPFSLPH